MPTLAVRTNYEIMGSFLQASEGTMYVDNIPQLTRDNITAVGNAILDYQASREAFYDYLINKITLQLFSRFTANNKFAFLKGMIVQGDIEDSYIDYIKGRTFDPTDTQPFKYEKGNIKTLFHKRNREDQYVVTVSDVQIRRAFLSENGLQSFLAQQVDALYQSNELDEYVLIKQLIADNYAHAGKVITIGGTTHPEVVTNLLYQMKKANKDLTYASREFNALEVMNNTPKEEQLFVLHKDYALDMDMGILANIFNMDKLKVESQILEVDNFNEGGHIVCAMLDRRGFRINDVLKQMESIRNPANMSTIYYLNVWQIISYAYFMNMVYFVEPADVTDEVEPIEVNIYPDLSAEETLDFAYDGPDGNYATSVTGALFNMLLKAYINGYTKADVYFDGVLRGENDTISAEVDTNGTIPILHVEPLVSTVSLLSDGMYIDGALQAYFTNPENTETHTLKIVAKK